MTVERDIEFTQRALALAAKGIGLVSPNPLVGCVIVSADGTVVGEGSYIYENVTHAEQIALKQAGEKARGATAYISLEPHDHHGKTEPCTEALINAGITRVVCPTEDPNPLVSGRGFERLRTAGVDVRIGLMADEGGKLNEKFTCWHKKHRPFVHLKLAVSLDGRISTDGTVSAALSGGGARKRVQALRHEYDAILVGVNTVISDDPQLTDRSGKPRRRPLVRVILDNGLKVPLESLVVKTADKTPTILVTRSGDEEKLAALRRNGVEIIHSEAGGRDLSLVLSELKDRGIQSILVEGGSEVAGSFRDAGLVDKFTFMVALLIIGGRSAPAAVGGAGSSSLDDATWLEDVTVTPHQHDVEITGYPRCVSHNAG